MENYIKNDIYYIGVNDHLIDLFESQFSVKNGMSYNSYLLIDEKIVVFDSVDKNFSTTWLENIKDVLKETPPDYLVISHMEPDHSGSIFNFIEKYPNTKIITNQKSLVLLNQFFNIDLNEKVILVKEGSTFITGKHELNFIMAPMVHWPEVMMTYDSFAKVLFSADAFGKFGALDIEDNWIDEARRYYFGIVSKYGSQVQNLLKKICNLEIESIYSLHGPILDTNICYYLELYSKWSEYSSEDANGIFIAYTSIYGNTKAAVLKLVSELETLDAKNIIVSDLSRTDMSKNIENAFRYGKIVLASTTYNNGIFPIMNDFITRLVEHNFQKKKIGIIENGSWAPQVEKHFRQMFSNSINIEIIPVIVHIKSALKDNNLVELKELAKKLI